MIKFGSRVDVLMPPETDIRVAINDAVTAGETLLGVVPEKSKTP
jgi:phosphatidylserine decarboxylase